ISAEVTEAPLELMQLLDRPERTRFVLDGTTTDYSTEDLRGMVMAIPNPGRDYKLYISIGMTIHSATSGSAEGSSIWHDWASRSDLYDAQMIDSKWHSFGKSANQITDETVIKLAHDNDSSLAVEFTDNTGWGELTASPESTKPAEIEDDSTDTYGGVVGAVYEWIDSQCLFPRRHISLAAALAAVSAAASLRY